MLEFFDQPPRWKLLAVSASMTVRIIVLWPVLVVSAARIKSGVTLQMSELSDHASPKLDQLISEARNQYCDFMLPLETFRELEAKIPWTDREHFESQLSELGFMITGFVKNCEGQDVPAAIWVVQTVGIPFALSTVQDGCDLVDAHRVTKKQGDQVWAFSSSEHSWKNLAGRAGVALVRDGKVVDALVTIMN